LVLAIQHYGKGQATETVKKSMPAKLLRERGVNRQITGKIVCVMLKW
jgi:hypothetical protein